MNNFGRAPGHHVYEPADVQKNKRTARLVRLITGDMPRCEACVGIQPKLDSEVLSNGDTLRLIAKCHGEVWSHDLDSDIYYSREKENPIFDPVIFDRATGLPCYNGWTGKMMERAYRPPAIVHTQAAPPPPLKPGRHIDFADE